MKRRKKAIALAAVFAAGVWAAFADPVILSSEDGRVWQTVFDPSAPLEWRWTDGAESATVTVTNALFGTVDAPIVVARTVNAKYGSVAMPNPARSADTGEGLVDVVLVQRGAGDVEISCECARLAFLPGVGGGQADLDSKPSFASPRVVPYDAAWTNADVSEVGVALAAGGDSSRTVLDGLGGYFPLAPVDGTATLDFDGVAYASVTVKKRHGTILIIR